MRHALDTVRIETEAQSRSHSQLVNSIRKELEAPLSDFMARIENLRRDSQTTVTKLYKHKQTQSQYVQRSRERYENNCTKINAYTAQSNLVQGRELDKLMAKLERVQANVETDDQDYQSYVRALQDTTQKWNAEYKSFLDICQDVEEERQEFLKTNLWGLANAVSSVCVTDDEACERVRVSLEGCDAIRDVQSFVREFATGTTIPPAPEYINFAQNAGPMATPGTGSAHFARLSTRSSEGMHPPSASVLSQQTPSQFSTPNMQPLTPGFHPMTPGMPTPMMPGTPTAASMAMPSPPGPSVPSYLATMNRTPPPQAISPSARTPPPSTSNRNSMFAPGAAPLSPSTASMQQHQHQQPQQQQQPHPGPARGMSPAPMAAPSHPVPQPMPQPVAQHAPLTSSTGTSRPVSQAVSEPENEDDPIAKALANLRLRQSRKSPAPGSRPTSMMSTTPSMMTDKALPPPAAAPAPTQPATSAAMPSQSPNEAPAQVMDPRWQRTISPDGRATGAAAAPETRVQRPTSPAAAFMHPPDRGTSPIPVEQIHHHYGQAFPTERRTMNASPVKDGPAAQAQAARATSPIGISLDARGAVTQDSMASRYGQPGPAASSAAAGVTGSAPAASSTSQLTRPPTGQYSESGEPILFYVKALYDYQASLPEEFSFTAGDIIAVTHTEPDGWWQGELLDEARRVPGANTFPSNFVVLLM